MPTGALAALAALLALAGTAAAAGECRFDEHTAYQQLAAGDTWELQMPVTSAGECCGAVAAREAWARGEQAARDLGLAGSFRDTPVPFRIKPSVFHSQSSLNCVPGPPKSHREFPIFAYHRNVSKRLLGVTQSSSCHRRCHHDQPRGDGAIRSSEEAAAMAPVAYSLSQSQTQSVSRSPPGHGSS
jgi:hypothetical protein